MKDENTQVWKVVKLSKCTFEMAQYVLHDSIDLERDCILAKELFNIGCPKEMVRNIIIKLPKK